MLERALPRFLDVFGRLGVHATFFVVAEDARANVVELRRALAAGHEIASHSLTHPVPFSCLSRQMLEKELLPSRDLLEELLGVPVQGFRAPGLALSAAVLDGVARAGYRYDSSLLPSPYVVVSLLTQRGYTNGRVSDWLLPALRGVFSPRHPHRRRDGLWELPLSTSPTLRLPLFHTPRLMLGRRAFDSLTRRSSRAEPYLQYVFHGIDLLTAEEVDGELHHHPGARLPLAEKIRIAEEILRRFLRRRTSRRLDAFLTARDASTSSQAEAPAEPTRSMSGSRP